MEAGQVQEQLQRCGVQVHHATRMPPTGDGRQVVVVFLEPGLRQHELARLAAVKLSGVVKVWFSGHTATIMFVEVTEPVARCSGRTARAGTAIEA